MNRMRADLIAEIKTARAEAQTKVNAYENIAAKRYDYRRALATVIAYHTAIAMLAQGTGHKIPGMAAEAVEDFELARDNDSAEMTLAIMDGRRDALATVADLMNTKEDGR